MSTKGYNVYRNDQFVKFIPSRSKAAMKAFIRDEAVIGTHMGEWRRTLTIEPTNAKKTAYEWEYSTTVGAYFKFRPAFN